MLKLYVLPTHFKGDAQNININKVNLCVAFFLWREKKNLPFLEMEFMVQFCINTFTIIYLWTPQHPANVLELFSIEFEPKIFSQIF